MREGGGREGDVFRKRKEWTFLRGNRRVRAERERKNREREREKGRRERRGRQKAGGTRK